MSIWKSPGHIFYFLCRVKAAQTELGQQILADFEEAFPSQGTKVLFVFSLQSLDSINIHTHYSYYFHLSFQNYLMAAISLFAKGSG